MRHWCRYCGPPDQGTITLEGSGALRAVLFKRAGSVKGLVLAEVPQPVPEPTEVLVRIHAATVTRGDVVLRKLPRLFARLFGLGRKTVLGHEFAGQVETLGADVTLFKEGDRVFGTTTGLQQGSHAEYICIPESGVIATIPDSVTYQEAAPVPVGGLTALFFLRQGNLSEARRILVYGASGSVGTFAVQLAKHFGAHVTGVCSTSNVELVRSLGADEVIDYTKEDVTGGDRTYDIAFDAVGKLPAKRARGVLAVNGAYVSVRSSTAKERTEDLLMLGDLLGAGGLQAVIDRRYPLEEVAEAHRYVEKGRKRGNVLIDVGG